MTNKEASEILNCMSTDLYLGLKDLGATSPFREVLAQRIEAIERAQDAIHYWDEHIRNSIAGGGNARY